MDDQIEQATAAPGEQRVLSSSEWFTREIAESLGLVWDEVQEATIHVAIGAPVHVTVKKFVRRG